MELVFFEAQGRADFGQIDDEVGLCLVLGESSIFDSSVLDFQHDVSAVIDRRYRGNSKCGRAKSANIELCVICRSSLKSKI